MRRLLGPLVLLVLTPAVALAQTAAEVERCFQSPSSCSWSGGVPTPLPQGGAPAPVASTAPAAPRGPDYATVLQSSEADRRKIQESLRTLDRYNGAIDGNLLSEASMKAISDWQRAHNYNAVGKLTPTEVVTLHNEAAKAPIKRLDPSAQAASAAPPSNADMLKALQAKLAERRKAAEPKANAATEALVKDLKAYVAADGKGVAGEQFSDFAKWYADTKAGGRTVGEIAPAVEDYGEVKAGAAATAEVRLETRQKDQIVPQCLVFAWIEGVPRKNAQTFSCDDVAGVEKWKTDQVLKSAWH